MNKINGILRKKDVGAIGIGAMIVFIAMILVAGVAASVLVQTSNTIQLQAMKTGRETTREISSGVQVFDIEGLINVTTANVSGNLTTLEGDMKYLGITLKARPGSSEIDLNNTYIMFSEGETKVLVRYGGYNDAALFANTIDATTGRLFKTGNWSNATNELFGIIVLQDYDGSVKRLSPVINRGDKIVLMVRCGGANSSGYNETAGCFGRCIPERTAVFGRVIPEVGAPGVISFTTPMSYNEYIFDLQ
jgi:flagellin FlaB